LQLRAATAHIEARARPEAAETELCHHFKEVGSELLCGHPAASSSLAPQLLRNRHTPLEQFLLFRHLEFPSSM
jgi:hypothetical protein